MIKKEIAHGGFASLVKRALELGIKVKFYPGRFSLVKFYLGEDVIFSRMGIIPLSVHPARLVVNKDLTKTILGLMDIRTPKGIVASSYGEAINLIRKEKIKYPFIAKPIDGTCAKGVTWNVRSKKELKTAVRLINSREIRKWLRSDKFLIEEMYIGDEYRVLVFDGEVISCVKKIPATIVGDGISTIQELVNIFNKKRKKGFEIKIDKVAKKTLSKNNLTLNSILIKNTKLKLRDNLNMSDGGRAIESTNKMSAFLKKTCVKSIQASGLSWGGVDLMTNNLSSKKNYVILEINSNPFYNMSESPLVEGAGIDVSGKILKNLFPKLKIK
ncbi:MAG: hypothetical protein NT136_00140 [Candidatus Moranbacteria bacterium]|nr:hypothetical protein [Candidatus Moranbacteria bacterium]